MQLKYFFILKTWKKNEKWSKLELRERSDETDLDSDLVTDT